MMSNHKQPSLSGCVTLPIHPDRLREVAEEVRDMACLSGCLFRTTDHPETSEVVEPAPFMLLPAPIPEELFRKMKDIQPYVNELYLNVSKDYGFLRDSLKGTVTVDEYTANQWSIMEEAEKAGRSKRIQLALLRTDYMLDPSRGEDLSLSQVEVNTTAPAMAGIASRLTKIHRSIVGELDDLSDVTRVPTNAACSGFAEAIHTAWTLYGNPTIIFDQKLLISDLREEDPTMRVRRRTMEYVGSNGALTEDYRFILDEEEVAVFYYRTGFKPDQFKSDTTWKAKRLAELSTAAVCPSIGWHLAGTKKVQQELARPGVLERFVPDPEKVALIRSTFTGLYSLDMGPEGDAAASRAIADPGKFVMKPQLEGGGHDIFGEDIKTILQSVGEERSKFTLMNRIPPHPAVWNYVIRSGYTTEHPFDCVNEFGCYGSLVSYSGDTIRNKADKHLVKTKRHDSDEVAMLAEMSSGLNSPFLI